MWSDKEPNHITNNILTNQSDHKDIWGSNRSRPGTPDIHEGCAVDGNNYIYNTPNHLEHNNWDILLHLETYQPQWPPEPSEMPPMPLPYPDPSEASERSSSLQVSPSLPLKKADIVDKCFINEYGLAWCFLEPLSCTHKEEQWSQARGGVRDEGRDRTNEVRGLPLLRVWQRDRDWSRPTRSVGLGAWTPIIGHCIHSLTGWTGGVMEFNKDSLGGNPMFNNEMTEVGGNVLQSD